MALLTQCVVLLGKGFVQLSHILKDQGGNLLSVFLSALCSLHSSLAKNLPWWRVCFKLTQNMGYVSMRKNARPTHRKWMWGVPGKTTETKAILKSTVVALMFMFREVEFFFWAYRCVYVCVNRAHKQKYNLNRVEFSLFETETPLLFWTEIVFLFPIISLLSLCLCGKLGCFIVSQTVCVH